MPALSAAKNIQSDGYLDPSVIDSLAKIMPENAVVSLLLDMERDVRERLVRLSETQVAQGSLKMIAQDSHDLRSMGGNFGLTELAQHAGTVERAARSENLDAVRASVPALISVGHQSLEALHEHQSFQNVRAS